MKALLLFLMTSMVINLFGQENKDDYKSIFKNNLEYKTNGIDTLILITKKPEFKGGNKKLNKFILNNLKYPESAWKDSVQGRVVVSFTIDTTGNLTDIYIKESVRKDLDEEAARVISIMPKWIPGEQKGKLIPIEFSIPIIFSL